MPHEAHGSGHRSRARPCCRSTPGTRACRTGRATRRRCSARNRMPPTGATACATAAVAGYAASVLAMPSGELDGEWLSAKAQGAAVGIGAFAVTAGVTSGLKAVASRERPNGADDESFPSGHASTAAVFNTLTVRNLQATGPVAGGTHHARDRRRRAHGRHRLGARRGRRALSVGRAGRRRARQLHGRVLQRGVPRPRAGYAGRVHGRAGARRRRAALGPALLSVGQRPGQRPPTASTSPACSGGNAPSSASV